MTGYCFISYSAADGLEFATKLADELQGKHPFIKVWLDKRELDASIVDWDDQLANAIKGCKCLVFLMTPDSTAKGSTCKEEWTWALKYKKPVICLMKDKRAEVPFRLLNRQYIDISNNFDAGIAQLRSAITRLDEPEGILEELDRRLSQAKRDLQRTPHEEEKPRIQAEIDDLNKQIEAQKKFVSDPKAAAEQTQANIEAGLERERKPEKPTAAQTSTKFINPPPGIAPNYFQDRQLETNEIVKFLNDDAQRMMTIVGRGGVGKTAMVCRLLKGLEGGELPDGLGRMRVEGIVYLSESGSHRVNFANLFYDLCKLLPSDAAQELDAVYKNPQGSTESKMRALLEKFGGGRVVALLDNFEPLVDTETFAIRDAELDEALRAFLNGTHSAVKVVITTRVAPRALNLIQPGRQRGLTLDEGLESPYAENILREMDSDGRLGLKSAGAEALNRARIKTRGFPRALEALFAILASDRYTTLDELLAMPLPENVVEALVGEAFNRLDTNAQKVMQALAVYNRPVTPAAVDYLLAPHIPAMDSAPILQRLANMHFARKESGRFYLHPVDREFAFGLIINISKVPDGSDVTTDKIQITNIQPHFIQHDLLVRAANYFAQVRKPKEEWKTLNDLAAQLAEFDLRYAAGDYDMAAKVISEIDFGYLLLWGHYRLSLDMYLSIMDKIKNDRLRLRNLYGLGVAHRNIGNIKLTVSYLEKGLAICRTIEAKDLESAILGVLGTAYSVLGKRYKAIEIYKQSFGIAQEIGDRNRESNIIGNLGNRYTEVGEIRKAIECHEQGLAIARSVNDKYNEGNWLSNLGKDLSAIGEVHKAIQLNEDALTLIKEISNRTGEIYTLGRLGDFQFTLGYFQKAKQYYEQALDVAYEIGYRDGISTNLACIGRVLFYEEDIQRAIQNLIESIQIADEISFHGAQHYVRYELAHVYLFQTDLINARATIEAALGYDEPQNNHNASALHGIIALRQGDEVAARGAFVHAIRQADEILSKTAEYYSALDAKGLAICGLALCRGAVPAPDTPAPNDVRNVSAPNDDGANTGRGDPAPTVEDAIETFRKARKIAPHAGIVKSVLRLFDELAKCDKDGALKDVRNAAEGKE